MIPDRARWIAVLADAGVPDPAGDLRRLFEWAYAKGAEDPEPQSRERPNDWTRYTFEDAVKARAARQPVAQIIGTRAFWRHEFEVTPDVLDPRPDTETLVEVALAHPFASVLDIGSGSGCILLSLLAERNGATGLGVDFSKPALEVARRNAERLGLAGRTAFRRSDWLAEVSERFDLIVSNPPYIDTPTYERLAPEVRDWEPRAALEAGADGLLAYRVIARQAKAGLQPGGTLCLEIGHDQGRRVPALLQAEGWSGITVQQDLNRKDRVITANLI